MARSRDISKVLTTIADLDAVAYSSASPSGAEVGDLWVDTSTANPLIKAYDGTNWDTLGSSPVPIITGIAPDNIAGSASTAIIINGSNFESGSIVKLINTSGTELFTLSTTFNNSRSLQFLTPTLTASAGPYDIKVTNPDNQVSILENALIIGGSPIWSTPSGSLGSIYDYARSSQTFTVLASDPDNQTVTYSIVDGSLPVGLSLAPNGTISGAVSGVASDTTYAFTIRASDSSGSYTDRGFSLTVRAPYVHTFSTVGSTNWVAPASGNIRVLIIGGGGGGGFQVGGGGGGGGFVEYTSFAVTAGQVYPIVVGAGGLGGLNISGTGSNGSVGGNSSFNGNTAFGGGGGGSHSGGSATTGGSGGGGGGGGTASNNGAGSIQTTPAGATAYGNAGGTGRSSTWAGGGGGGAGGTGNPSPSNDVGGTGGNGRTSDITGVAVYYAGGGGGCNNVSNTLVSGGLGGGGFGIGDNGLAATGTTHGGNGTNGLGGGGGGVRDWYQTSPSYQYYTRAGNGGSGVVILRY